MNALHDQYAVHSTIVDELHAVKGAIRILKLENAALKDIKWDVISKLIVSICVYLLAM